jgi:poly-gamma-glutamate capsule biosynthesis protein CapA/YwtB (metallophosphatase superfamily)
LLPYRIRRFRLTHAGREDAAWLRATLDRESQPLGCRIALHGDRRLAARWN